MSDLTDKELEDWARRSGITSNPCMRDTVLFALVSEIVSHRAMVGRLEAWANELAAYRYAGEHAMTLGQVAAELRKRMGGDHG